MIATRARYRVVAQRFGNWDVPLYLMGVLFLAGAVCWAVIDPKRPVFE